MEKLKIPYAVVVEGKYDKIKLSSIIDSPIIVTNGFGIYKNSETARLIRYYAEKTGIVILTDSDTAGFRIRGHIKSIVPKGKIINLYSPEIFGKEKRKIQPSKEGKLGVEGISAEKLRKLFVDSGLVNDAKSSENPITSLDFYELKLSGSSNSGLYRKRILNAMNLPENLTAKALLEAVSARYSKEEFIQLVQKIQEDIV
jgi:ribonuclease M5